MTQDEAHALWRRERTAQIDWMDSETRAGTYPAGPYTQPMPAMTVPPPFSPDWYRRYPR